MAPGYTKPNFIQFGTAEAMHEEIVSLREQLRQKDAEINQLKAEAELGNIPYKEAVALRKRVEELEIKLALSGEPIVSDNVIITGDSTTVPLHIRTALTAQETEG